MCVAAQPFGVATASATAVSLSFLPFRRAVRLTLGGRTAHLGFRVRLDYGVEQRAAMFETALAGYAFEILEPDEREILAFHWHPDGASPVRHPHLHLSGRMPEILLGRSRDAVSLSRVHIPTGILSFAAVVRMLIEEFGVEPRRSDWQAILDAEQATPDPV
jgi:hypothetical protein